MPLKAVQAKDEREPVTHHLTSVLNFGQYAGRTIEYVLDVDPNYIIWAYENIEWFDIDSEVEELATEVSFDHYVRDYAGYDMPDVFD